jgi:hypothetical protein
VCVCVCVCVCVFVCACKVCVCVCLRMCVCVLVEKCRLLSLLLLSELPSRRLLLLRLGRGPDDILKCRKNGLIRVRGICLEHGSTAMKSGVENRPARAPFTRVTPLGRRTKVGQVHFLVGHLECGAP